MKALHGIYQNGQIDFLFSFPDHPGPVNVLVIFPDEETHTWPEPGPLFDEEDGEIKDFRFWHEINRKGKGFNWETGT